MKNLLVYYDDQKNFTTELETASIPGNLGPHEILIKVSVAGSNPKDYKHPLPAYYNNRINQGDDCAGTVAAVGSSVSGFHVGDRVAGFHEMDTAGGTYAEYAVCPSQTVFHLPASVSNEEAATIPLAMYTAAVGLYRNLRLPAPWDRSDENAAGTAKIPLVVNAASGAVGAFAVKLAKMNPQIGPIIATAGSSAAFVHSIGADAVVDYRSPTVADDIKKAAGGRPINQVFDASNSVASVKYLTAVLNGKGGRYTCTLPPGPNPTYGLDGPMQKLLEAAGVWFEQIWVGDVHETTKAGGQLFGGVMSRVVEQALEDGKLIGHPFKVVEGGLHGVEAALMELKARKWSGNAKLVTRIADTRDTKQRTSASPSIASFYQISPCPSS